VRATTPAFALRVILCASFSIFVSSGVSAQTLTGETFRGTFVTMTRGAKCPSTSTIAFTSQGEANGDVPGMFDDQGFITLAFDEDALRLSIQALTTRFTINKFKISGEFVWQPADATPLHVSCDPLTLRLDGHVRYRVTKPFVENGLAQIRISGSRRVITSPYFGSIAVTFLPIQPAR
jgi:hypothetical protein